MATYITHNGILYSGAKAKRIAIEQGSKKFDTRITNVEWQETYRIKFDGNSYRVVRIRNSHTNDWNYSVMGGTFINQRWCDPEGKTHKRVVAALLKLIEV